MKSYAFSKYFKLAVIVYAVLDLAYSVITFLLNTVDGIEGIASFVFVLLLFVTATILYKNIVGFEQNKYKSIPLLLLPIGISKFTNDVFNYLLDMLKLTDNSAINDAISAAATLIICLFAYSKLITGYSALYEEKSSLQFPVQYRLRTKWWFVIVGDLVGSIVIAMISTIFSFAGAFLMPIVNALNIIILLAIVYAFFNIALKKIDKNTRKLFLPNIFLPTVASLALNSVSDLVDVLTPLHSINNSFKTLLSSGDYLAAFAKVAPSLIFTLFLAVSTTVVYCFLCAKNFAAYEQSNNE
ncbi:MAG: hypothetical protein IJS03_01335 [Eubacterium sp.]|nr:hypothetical protein [Eubacterium sp.]